MSIHFFMRALRNYCAPLITQIEEKDYTDLSCFSVGFVSV